MDRGWAIDRRDMGVSFRPVFWWPFISRSDWHWWCVVGMLRVVAGVGMAHTVAFRVSVHWRRTLRQIRWPCIECGNDGAGHVHTGICHRRRMRRTVEAFPFFSFCFFFKEGLYIIIKKIKKSRSLISLWHHENFWAGSSFLHHIYPKNIRLATLDLKTFIPTTLC